MKRFSSFLLLVLVISGLTIPYIGRADSTILTPDENLWLKSRNYTIVVYPESNSPPYSYEDSSGAPEGMSIDYLKLIAQKVGAKLQFLPPRPLSQIIDDVKQNNKSDVIASITDTKNLEDFLYFSDNYVTSPAVIVVRKDLDTGNTLTLDNLSGKRVAVGDQYAVEDFISTNNPQIILEPVVDDESGLQQVVLGEVDAAVMDVTSLSYYLSKQVLSSVKVVGNTGFDYKPAFAVTKDKEILQSILDKGLQQISPTDRQAITDKWVSVPYSQKTSSPVFPDNIPFNVVIYIILCIIILVLIVFLIHRRHYLPSRFHRKANKLEELKEEVTELEVVSQDLVEELNDVKTLEQDIKEKIKNIN